MKIRIATPKTNPNKYRALIALLIIAGAAAPLYRRAWCASPSSSGDAHRQFRLLVTRFIDSDMRLFPERATEAGDHRYDGQLSNLSADGFEARVRHARDWKARFASWQGALPAADEADREWLMASLDEELLWDE